LRYSAILILGLTVQTADEEWRTDKMSKSRIGPEAKIITLFAALPEDSRRIVLDVLKSQSAPTPRKAAKKAAGSPVERKEEANKKDSGALCVANVPTLDVPCGEPESALIHDIAGGYASYHEFEGPKLVARAPRKSKQKPEAALSDQSSEIETVSAISASSGGD
jgi:hypothetical protein